jgi:ribulose-phosphate 3-epimerase
MKHLIAPSMLSANFLHLESDIEMINNSQADWFHLDVMDGMFVPNISFGPMIIGQMAKKATKTMDTHLMIEDPDRYILDFKNAGTDYLTVHYEACRHLHRSVQAIKKEGLKAGVSLNPHTPISVLEDIIADVDLVLIMSVNPGFGGQKFIENSYAKIERLNNLISQKNSQALIEVDGGVNLENAPKLVAAGADVLVAGNAIFKAENPTETIRKMKSLEN